MILYFLVIFLHVSNLRSFWMPNTNNFTFHQFNRSNRNQLKFTKYIINITCVVDSYGTGYRGVLNVSNDGTPCVHWKENRILYTRYRLKGRNVIKNYCRNPDNDSNGPWCFVKKRNMTLRRKFQFKHCNVPICKNAERKVRMGVYLKMIKRNCPFGFEKYKKPVKYNFLTYCILKSEIIKNLPVGNYKFELLDKDEDASCYKGFKKVKSKFMEKYYCVKESPFINEIKFPSYILPKPKDIVFMAMTNGNSSCPQMSNKTITVIFKTLYYALDSQTLCYYFYKLSNRKKPVDRRLAFMTMDSKCPMNYRSVVAKNLFTYREMSKFRVCQPTRNQYKYVDGTYCLVSLKSSEKQACPQDFVSVIIWKRSKNFMLCCRQRVNSMNKNVSTSVYNLLKFYGTKSFWMLGNRDCATQQQESLDLKSSEYQFPMLKYNKCENCDILNSSPITGSIIFLPGCVYEKIRNGFAYASLNGRCPKGTKFSSLRMSPLHSAGYYQSRSVISFQFCSVIDYPANITFPKGKYCVYKIGFYCPNGFKNLNNSLIYGRKNKVIKKGETPNFLSNAFCCRFDHETLQFDENDTMPYVTKYFQFGLPLPTKTMKCFHGLQTHTSMEGQFICQYYPTNVKKGNYIISTSTYCNRQYLYYPSYRHLYYKNSFSVCKFYVTDNPPPGNYCSVFYHFCPEKYFYYVTYHPLQSYVICCRKPTNNDTEQSKFTMVDWSKSIKQISVIAYKRVCPVFRGYNYQKYMYPVTKYFKANDIGDLHKRNLTKIGMYVIVYSSYAQVGIKECYYKLDPYNLSVTWPSGRYALPKPLSGCSKQFKEGYIEHQLETSNPSFTHSDVIHLAGDYSIGGSKLRWEFCTKDELFKSEAIHLPYGRYCVLQVRRGCPYAFQSGYVKFVEVTVLHKKNKYFTTNGTLPNIKTDGPYIQYNFCCRSGRGDIVHSPMDLPIESGPFYLFRYGKHCQSVRGMRHTQEYICIDSEDTQQFLNYTFQAPYYVHGYTPISGSYALGCDFQINMCYYEKDVPKTETNTTEDSDDEQSSWPKGRYGFIKSIKQNCPPDFKEGRTLISDNYPLNPRFMQKVLFGKKDSQLVLSYCKRDDSNDVINQTDARMDEVKWPKGVYCLFFEGSCPTGMLSYVSKLINKINFRHLWGSWLMLKRLCCRYDVGVKSQKFFPGHHYTTIVVPQRNYYYCPKHEKTKVAQIFTAEGLLCIYESIPTSETSVNFPKVSNYLLPTILYRNHNCPAGFKKIIDIHKHFSKLKPDLRINFCQIEHPDEKVLSPVFPTGRYCVLTKSEVCPSAQFTKEHVLVIPGYHLNMKFSHYLACCQEPTPTNSLFSNYGAVLNKSSIDFKFKVAINLFSNGGCSFIDDFPHTVLSQRPTPLMVRGLQQSGLVTAGKDVENTIGVCAYDDKSWYMVEAANCHCDPNAECIITLLSVSCHCHRGYYGNGKVCGKITNSTGSCGNVCASRTAKCVYNNVTKSSNCQCKKGFVGNGFNCKPSCDTRKCSPFSHCVVDSFESYCLCQKGTIETPLGTCHGDLINTIYHLDYLSDLQSLNMSCLDSEAVSQLTDPNSELLLILLLPPNPKVFNLCQNTARYYALVAPNSIEEDLPWKMIATTKIGWQLLMDKDEANKWIVNGNINVTNYYKFTNAIILRLEKEITDDYSKHTSQAASTKIKTTVGGVFIGILVLGIIVAVIFITINCRRRRKFYFGKLSDSRSETNIHFLSSAERVEID